MRLTGSGLMTPIQYLRGVGSVRAKQFAKLNIKTVEDLLFHVPRRYIDRSRMLSIRDLRVGDEATVIARVVAAGARRTRSFKQVVSIVVADGSGTMEAVWFNRPDLKDRFEPNTEVMLSGEVTAYRGKQFVNPAFELLEEGGEFSGTNVIIPVYPLTEGLSVWVVRRLVRTAMDKFGSLVEERLTREILRHYQFPGIHQALEAIHFPTDVAAAMKARERLSYEELFYLELLLALRRQQNRELHKGRALIETGALTARLRQALPFRLTGAQERVIGEIRADMARARCMNRLLQGDVGSGKTVVALYAMLIACENGEQAAMMAPTEILAEQHFRGWNETLAGLGVKSALLTGSTVTPERREVVAGLESGTVQVVFGTHALIEDRVRFASLGLVVVDEQHRFGVMQRAALLNKGLEPDFLVMTATPIPRTLTLTIYGDMDYSVLDEKPPGRKETITRLVNESRRAAAYAGLARRLEAGEQAFVICPVIEESEKLELASAVETYEKTRAAFPQYRVGLVHGRLKPAERNQLMDRFRSGELHILVATAVIEVGVDVPNATVMFIEHPERFGLAQLHQLRGRIGRGGRQSYCILMASDCAAQYSERLKFFVATGDGFALAERDLQLRGPGEILGTRQHGLPDLKVADLTQDRAVLDHARRDAFRMIELDPQLRQPQNNCIRSTLLQRYAGRAELLRVG